MKLKEKIDKYKEELKQILNALNSCYFDDLEQDSFDDDIVYPFQNSYKKNFRDASGATKGVLIFKDFGFVIKIPFIFCDEEELCGAEDGINAWDYCSQEAYRYEMAKKEGFEGIFLETKFLDYIKGHPIYIQSYADILETIDSIQYSSNHCSSNEKDKEKVEQIDIEENYDWLDWSWEADLLVQYGIETFKKFKKYLKDNWITDLRDANIGYVGKRPVLVDYAGFNN